MTRNSRHATTDRIAATPDLWNAVGDWLARRGALPWLACVTFAVAAIHWGVFRGEMKGDDLTFHFAESVRIADCLRNFDFDLWNPSANGGYASAYYYQVVPQLASAIPAALLGHHLFFFQLSVFLPLVLAPACAYRGMRLIDATPWQAAVAAFVIAFMNGESRWGAGNAGTFQVGLYTQTWGLCVFPLALGHGARWIGRGFGLSPAVGWGAFSFLCHPFVGICLGISWVVAFLCKFIVRWQLWLSPTMLAVIAMYLGAGGIGLAGTAAVLTDDVELPGTAIACAVAIAALGAALRWKSRDRDAHWSNPRVRAVAAELHRLAVLGVLLVLTTAPVLLPLAIDRAGFGGFPHRVADEVGPGFRELQRWYASGVLLDFAPASVGRRLPLLTLCVPVLFAFTSQQRRIPMRWLWPPAAAFALWLGIGPHAGKVGDDLLPAVRALGAMQTVLGLGVGAGIVMLGQWIWNAPWDRWIPISRRAQGLSSGEVSTLVYVLRTAIAAIAAAGFVFVAYPGWRALDSRVVVLADDPNSYREELFEVIDALKRQPPGRKQAGTGAESHWWNLLPYVYGRIPALLQMGGGGLQASPNYDFITTHRDYVKNAWIYDAPYLVFRSQWSEQVPAGDTIFQTDHYEVRKLAAPGLVSAIHVVGTLPPGYRGGELGHVFALAWHKSSLGLSNRAYAYAGSGAIGPAPSGRVIDYRRQESPGAAADIVARVEASAPTTFCIRESWHPRWRAYVDGISTPIRRVTPDFPAIDVGPGAHTLELRFDRPCWTVFIWLLWPGLILLAWTIQRTTRPQHW